MPRMGLVVDRRFNGPPASGQGGWSAGLLAEQLGGDAVAVDLRLPPPLRRCLVVERQDGALVALDGDAVVMRARPAELEVTPPAPVGVAAARATTSPWGHRHPFPTCFGCGPDRERDDGLRLFAGRARDDGTYAVSWTPSAEFGDPAPRRLVWAALDCPTAAPLVDPPPEQPMVLARLAIEQRGCVRAGVEHVIGSWTVSVDGRKRRSAGVLWTAEGEVLAVAEALWIELQGSSRPV